MNWPIVPMPSLMKTMRDRRGRFDPAQIGSIQLQFSGGELDKFGDNLSQNRVQFV
jgi:hypothetical protein